jgi:hypothetical protein
MLISSCSCPRRGRRPICGSERPRRSSLWSSGRAAPRSSQGLALGVTSYTDPETGLRFENIRQTDEGIELDIVFPNSELEQASERALLPSLRTYSSSFLPKSINGEPW